MCNWGSLRGVREPTKKEEKSALMLTIAHFRIFSNNCTLPSSDGSLSGSVYTFSLSDSFNTTSNFSDILHLKAIAGGAGSNIDPTFIDGVMFANDGEFYLYGGAAMLSSDSTEASSEDTVLGYEAYQYDGVTIQDWDPMWWTDTLPDNMTTYITNGAGESAPSENLGFYFSGMHASSWGSIFYPAEAANITANTLITVNMTVMRSETWENDTIPSYVQGRANAELVWVPVSESGVLVAIGGAYDPADLLVTLSSNQTALNEKLSPTFMETVPVYDVSTKTWYLQNTTGDTPPQLTEFCSVLASAADGSSHNIYIYGGETGTEYSEAASDDVYVLSLPSFTWVKVYNGTNTHGRSRHTCIKVYPDQMLAIGGLHVDYTQCLEDGMIANFNLNNLTFQNYDPAEWSDYKVPDLLTAKIGGDSSGGATVTSPSSWTNSSLEGIFSTKYTKTISTYWPYNTTSTDTTTTHHKKFPTWAAAVIGVLCGLLVIGLIIVALWFWLRRRQRRQAAKDDPVIHETDGRQRLTSMYGGGPTSPIQGPTSISTGQETSIGIGTIQESIDTSASPGTVESGGGAVHEMQDAMQNLPANLFLPVDSSPIELPTAFNVSSSAHTNLTRGSSLASIARGSSPSPILPQTPASETGQSFIIPSHQRSMSTRSIDNVFTGRMSHFHETFETGKLFDNNGTGYHERHGSEVSEASSTANVEKAPVGEVETIHENE
ncbi:hypothetical protein N7466_004081 [Penicillium verhagenii]|uniref:uncharacterized protein n=1 Tax=Penicillium verhagenii TaxID=1562060 RepID=UPI00254562F8|nr:uncharacterized protein N7466_004081 [Penicillium verhagenii]KAJ5934534.1 hypothetical protein N7466_004081 [Penicillium verhagenii]